MYSTRVRPSPEQRRRTWTRRALLTGLIAWQVWPAAHQSYNDISQSIRDAQAGREAAPAASAPASQGPQRPWPNAPENPHGILHTKIDRGTSVSVCSRWAAAAMFPGNVEKLVIDPALADNGTDVLAYNGNGKITEEGIVQEWYNLASGQSVDPAEKDGEPIRPPEVGCRSVVPTSFSGKNGLAYSPDLAEPTCKADFPLASRPFGGMSASITIDPTQPNALSNQLIGAIQAEATYDQTCAPLATLHSQRIE